MPASETSHSSFRRLCHVDVEVHAAVIWHRVHNLISRLAGVGVQGDLEKAPSVVRMSKLPQPHGDRKEYKKPRGKRHKLSTPRQSTYLLHRLRCKARPGAASLPRTSIKCLQKAKRNPTSKTIQCCVCACSRGTKQALSVPPYPSSRMVLPGPTLKRHTLKTEPDSECTQPPLALSPLYSTSQQCQCAKLVHSRQPESFFRSLLGDGQLLDQSQPEVCIVHPINFQRN